jgi:hypothetical protein
VPTEERLWYETITDHGGTGRWSFAITSRKRIQPLYQALPMRAHLCKRVLQELQSALGKVHVSGCRPKRRNDTALPDHDTCAALDLMVQAS